MLAYIAL